MSQKEAAIGQNELDRAGQSEAWWLYRAGGVSALAFGIGYAAIIALFARAGAPPSGAEALLPYLAANPGAWWGILGLSVLTDFLLIPVTLGLYLALKRGGKPMMLLASACVGLFIVLDLALTWTNYAALIEMSASYAAAADETQRAALVTAAQYPAGVINSILLFVYNTLTLSVGMLLTGLAMLRSGFGKATAYLGAAAGVLGIAAVAGSFWGSTTLLTVVTSALTTIWYPLAGFRLYRLGGRRNGGKA